MKHVTLVTPVDVDLFVRSRATAYSAIKSVAGDGQADDYLGTTIETADIADARGLLAQWVADQPDDVQQALGVEWCSLITDLCNRGSDEQIAEGLRHAIKSMATAQAQARAE